VLVIISPKTNLVAAETVPTRSSEVTATITIPLKILIGPPLACTILVKYTKLSAKGNTFCNHFSGEPLTEN
jgi:hypothetical protein